MEPVEGDGWRTVTGRRGTSWLSVDDLIPPAPWLWTSLESYCVAACCGFDAFDLTHVAVRFACGDDLPGPALDLLRAEHRSLWRDPAPGDPAAVAATLERHAVTLRRLAADGVAQVLVARWGEVASPASYAEVYDALADHLLRPLATGDDRPE